MKTWQWIFGAGLAGLTLAACNKDRGSRELTTERDQVSYIIGRNIGQNFRQQGLDSTMIDLEQLRRGMEEAMRGTEPRLTEEQTVQIMTSFQESMMRRLDSLNTQKGEANRTSGEEFLRKNANEPGVVTLPSGLQYKVVQEGNGPKPGPNSTVTVHYRGTLVDGTEFDSSIKRGEPATFPVNGVIPGWVEALQLMPVGSKWILYVPPALAYGDRPAGELIGPNSVLIFEVELLSIAQ